MKSIQVTLYEIFGYLFPGAIFLTALFLVYWTLFLPAQQNLDGLTTSGWFFVIAVAYVLGHIVQALANLLMGWFKPEELILTRGDDLCLPNEVIQRAEAKAGRLLGLERNVKLEELPRRMIYNVCDHYLQQKGDIASRDIYVYREGFYRGIAVASVALAIGFIVRAVDSGATIAIWGIESNLALGPLITLTFVSLLMSCLFFLRYRRFAKYRAVNSVYGCLVISGGDDD